MIYSDIKVSTNHTHFLYNGNMLFDKYFEEVLKFHAPGFAPVKDQSGWYHIDINGNSIYKERYNRVFGFYCNRAAVVLDDLWFHVNVSGNRVYQPSFAWAGNYQEDLCTVRDYKGNYFHIDLQGERVYPECYLYAGDYKEGVASVKNQNGMFKHIDTNGKPINGKEFLDLGLFHKNFATAKDKLGWFHIDNKGNEIYNYRYLYVEPFYNGFALVTQFDETKIIIDESGKIIHKI